MDGWNTSFLLGWLIFRGYVNFRECKLSECQARKTSSSICNFNIHKTLQPRQIYPIHTYMLQCKCNIQLTVKPSAFLRPHWLQIIHDYEEIVVVTESVPATNVDRLPPWFLRLLLITLIVNSLSSSQRKEYALNWLTGGWSTHLAHKKNMHC